MSLLGKHVVAVAAAGAVLGGAGCSPDSGSAPAPLPATSSIAIFGGNGQTDTVAAVLAMPLAVIVRDATGAPLGGVVVTWTALDGSGGALTAATSTTNGDGIASSLRTLGHRAGDQNTWASVAGVAGSPVTFVASATPGAPSAVVKLAGDSSVTAPSALINYSVAVRDQYHNGVPGVGVTWEVGTGGGSITPVSASSNALGVSTVLRILGETVGSQTATALVSGFESIPLTFTTTAAVFVTVSNNSFSPNSVFVPVGGAVAWRWGVGANAHTITWDTANAPANEPDRTTGTVTRVFPVAGTYLYHCNHHVGMTGQVVVTP